MILRMGRAMLRRATGARWPKIRAGEHVTCIEVGLLMQRFVDGELVDDAQVDVLAAHLERCARCDREVETYRRLKDALERRQPPVDPQVVDRLREYGRRLADG